MSFRIKPFAISAISWAKSSMRMFLIIYVGILLFSIALVSNIVTKSDNVTYSMNYLSTFMIFIFINGIVLGASKHLYDIWLSLGMTRKEIVVGFAVKIAIMSGLVVITYVLVTYGMAFLQSLIFKTDVSSIVRTEMFFSLYSLNPLTFAFAAFFMTFSTCTIGFIIGTVLSRWKKIALGVVLFAGVLFFLATTNLIKDPMGTLTLLRQVFKPVEMFINYFMGDYNAITIGVHNLVISVAAIMISYVITLKRIARIN